MARGWMAALAAGALLAAAPLARAGTVAPGALIDVQWNASSSSNIMVGNAVTGSTDVGAGSTAATTDIWNQANSNIYDPADGIGPSNNGHNTALSLSDVYGNVTGATLSVGDPQWDGNLALGPYGGYMNSPSNNALSPYYANVTNLGTSIEYVGYQAGHNPADEIKLEFNGLSAGTYNLYMYMSHDNNNVSTKGGLITANGVGPTALGPDTSHTLTAGSDYVELTGITVSGTGLLTVDYVPQVGQEADLSGLQLSNVTPTPEPASLSLLGLGALGLLARRRK